MGLEVNVDASDPRRFKRLGHRWLEHSGGDGELRAELLDEGGSPLKGYQRSRSDPFQGDSQSHLMTWGGRIGSIASQGKENPNPVLNEERQVLLLQVG